MTRVSHLKLVQNPVFEIATVKERMHSWVRCFEVFDFSKGKQTGRHLRAGLPLQRPPERLGTHAHPFLRDPLRRKAVWDSRDVLLISHDQSSLETGPFGS